MHFDMTAHLNWVEVVWLLVALVGLFFAITNLSESERDRQRAEDVKNGLRSARLVVAQGYVYRNRVRVAIFVWWVGLGILFGFFEVPRIIGLGGLLGLMATAAGFALIGAQETIERRALAVIIARQKNADTIDVASDTIERKAEIVAAKLEVTAQEAADRLREISRQDGGMAADQRRSADAAERTADSNAELLARQIDSTSGEDAGR